VRSSVVTTPATANRVHAFRSRADAEKHADKHGGTVLSEAEMPFH
jgi:nitrous oxide reductase accessory protein NosL